MCWYFATILYLIYTYIYIYIYIYIQCTYMYIYTIYTYIAYIYILYIYIIHIHIYIYTYIYIYYIYLYICLWDRKTITQFFVTLYMWYSPLIDLNTGPLNFVHLSGHEFNSHSEKTLYSYSSFVFCLRFIFHFDHCLH